MTRAKLVVVTGSRGGCGVTHMATLLARGLADHRKMLYVVGGRGYHAAAALGVLSAPKRRPSAASPFPLEAASAGLVVAPGVVDAPLDRGGQVAVDTTTSRSPPTARVSVRPVPSNVLNW